MLNRIGVRHLDARITIQKEPVRQKFVVDSAKMVFQRQEAFRCWELEVQELSIQTTLQS